MRETQTFIPPESYEQACDCGEWPNGHCPTCLRYGPTARREADIKKTQADLLRVQEAENPPPVPIKNKRPDGGVILKGLPSWEIAKKKYGPKEEGKKDKV